MMTLYDYLLIAALVLLTILAIRKAVKKRGSCCGNCACCAAHCAHTKETDRKQVS